MSEHSARFPVAVLTGFLGSGKTTLLRRLLSDPKMSRVAVLINEFGEIGLDHLFVKSVAEGAVILQNGCICCTLRTDLQQGLRDLIDGGGDAAFPDFDRVVIETTGLADPAPIVQTLLIDPLLRHQLRLANIITTVDSTHATSQLNEYPEALRQAAIADRLVVTKTDLVAPSEFASLAHRLTRLNPTARIFDVQSPAFDGPSLLFEGVVDPGTKLDEVRHWMAGATKCSEGEEHHEGANEHVHLVHSSDIRSFSIRIEKEVDWAAFGVWLTALLHCHGNEILRLKGLLNVSDALGPVVLNGVEHVIYPPTHIDEWPDGDRASRLVFVVRGIDPAALGHSLKNFLRAAQEPNE